MLFVSAGLTTLEPVIQQFLEHQVVAFQVVDTPEGDTARGDWAGRMQGVVRPLLQWQTQAVRPLRGAIAAVVGEK
jgi:lipopolysaccharide transport system ATP-binding protein